MSHSSASHSWQLSGGITENPVLRNNNALRLWPVFLPHLLVVVLPGHEVIHQSDPVAQLLAQGVQELVCVSAAWRPGEGEQFFAVGQHVVAAV